jgi:E3 ubiquitin-protein ligase HECTD4
MVVQEEDLHTLLVKAWETKVFPVIQRRFRNDQERKSGLEQIKGALQLGMEGIAQETVEFLYEENGGAPKDLHLPTMDDVKADLGKFTISKVSLGLQTIAVLYNIAGKFDGLAGMRSCGSAPASFCFNRTRESVYDSL